MTGWAQYRAEVAEERAEAGLCTECGGNPSVAPGFVQVSAAEWARAKEAEAELERLRRRIPWDQAGADRLADEVAILIRLGDLDSRSRAGDALLAYRDPPAGKRADEVLALRRENAQLKAWKEKVCLAVGWVNWQMNS